MESTEVRLDWGLLLSVERLPNEAPEPTPPAAASQQPDWLVRSRTETERDFDRVLFAAPTRRLGDKTQVFPLEKNESVRNRLTHSHEVANIARSIGTHLVHSELGTRIVREAVSGGAWSEANVKRAVPAILAAVGLAHDLGNPPFGHQGEEAIRGWIENNEDEIFEVSGRQRKILGDAGVAMVRRDLGRLTPAHRKDFKMFEGNAQTLRTLTRLQVVKDNRGLNLTFGTLGALMKYTVPSDQVQRKGGIRNVAPPAKKVGYFASEAPLVERVRRQLGLPGHVRHPLTHIMEACDDIAYLVVDAEDAVKKQIVSFHDLVAWLSNRKELHEDPLTGWVLGVVEEGVAQARGARLSPSEVNDVSMQIFRANAITAMVSAAICAFEENYHAIMTTGLDAPLLELSRASKFAKAMKEFDLEHAYQHRRVLEVELRGNNTINGLLAMLWRGITERESFEHVDSSRTSPFTRYTYGRISENYRRVFEGRVPYHGGGADLPIRYRELQLLTDMVAGMTDQFAIDLHQELRSFHADGPEVHV